MSLLLQRPLPRPEEVELRDDPAQVVRPLALHHRQDAEALFGWVLFDGGHEEIIS